MYGKVILVSALLSYSCLSMAASGVGFGGGFGQDFRSVCSASANEIISDFGANMPFMVNDQGKVVFEDKERISKRVLNNGLEKIVYKSQLPDFSDRTGKSTKDVETTVTIKRDINGKITDISKEDSSKYALDGKYVGLTAPGFKAKEVRMAQRASFSNKDDSCEVVQKTYEYIDTNNASNADVVVTYDKTLCDGLNSTLKRMGTQNAVQCAGLIAEVESALGARNSQLKNDKKRLAFQESKAQLGAFVSAASVIQGCGGGGAPHLYGGGFMLGGFGTYGSGAYGGGTGYVGGGYGTGGGFVIGGPIDESKVNSDSSSKKATGTK